jgi:hypothetical protein
MNGAVTQSAVVTVMGEEEGPYLQVLQEGEMLHFELHGMDESASLEIFDLQGRLIQQSAFSQSIDLSLEAMPKTLMLYRVKSAGRQFGGKIVPQR